jgi:parvulin-like peptidyl-prolyl isomerase
MRKRTISHRFVEWAGAALLLAGCGQGALKDEEVLAQVEGRAITVGAYRQQAARVAASLQEELDPQRYVQALIDEELLVQEAVRRGLERVPEVERAFQQETRMLALRELYSRQHIEAPPPSPEEELQAFFSKSPYNRRVRFSLLMVKTAEQIPPLLAKLKARANFDSLSMRHSQDQRILDRKADMGYHRWGETMPSHAALTERAFFMKPGEIVGPLKVADGYFLIKLTDAHPVSLDQERETIAQQVMQEKLSERLTQYYASLGQQYSLQFDEAGFQALAADWAAQAPPEAVGSAMCAMHAGHQMARPASSSPPSPGPRAALDPQRVVVAYQGGQLTVEQCRPLLQPDAPRSPEALRNYLFNQLCRQMLAPLEIGRLELLKIPALQEGLEKAKRRVLIRQLQAQMAVQVSQPNPNAVRIYFEERKDRYTLPALVEVRRMNVADAQEGQQVLQRLQAGQDTLTLVKKFIALNYGSSALEGESKVARALREGAVGSFQGPFYADTGFFVLQILGRHLAQAPPFETVQERAKADLAQEQGNVLFQEFLKELRNRSASQVQIDQEKIQQLAKPTKEGRA